MPPRKPKKPCVHHWILNEPGEQHVTTGDCKKCGAHRTFKPDLIEGRSIQQNQEYFFWHTAPASKATNHMFLQYEGTVQ